MKDYVLICEDNRSVLQVTVFVLEAEGYTVDTAANTDEIFRKLEKDRMPSLIILDLNIPEVGGESVIQQLRSREETRSIPIILFSGEEKLEEIATRLKVDGFLRKPFENADLKAVARKFVTVSA